MNAGARYLAALADLIDVLASTQQAAMADAAERIAAAISSGGRVWVAATSHTLHTELVMRAGGLAAVHALGDTPDLAKPMLGVETAVLDGDGTFAPAPGDVVLVGTNAGTDAGTVEVAARARSSGCVVIALTSVGYERWPDVVRDHPSTRVLVDLADVVVDIGGVVGDGIVELRGLDTAVGPTSGALLVAAAWAIVVDAAERLLERGLVPIVYRSVQIPGAERLFEERKGRYEATGRGAEAGPESTSAGASTTG